MEPARRKDHVKIDSNCSPRISRLADNSGRPGFRYTKIAKAENDSGKNCFNSQQRQIALGSKIKRNISERDAGLGKIVCLDNFEVDCARDKDAERLFKNSKLKTFAQGREGGEDVDEEVRFQVETDAKMSSTNMEQNSEKFEDLNGKLFIKSDRNDSEGLDDIVGDSNAIRKNGKIAENSKAAGEKINRHQFGFAEKRIHTKMESNIRRRMESNIRTKTQVDARSDKLKMSENEEDSIVKGSMKPLQSDPPSSASPVKPLQSSLTNNSLSVSKMKKPVEISRELKKPIQCELRGNGRTGDTGLKPQRSLIAAKGSLRSGIPGAQKTGEGKTNEGVREGRFCEATDETICGQKSVICTPGSASSPPGKARLLQKPLLQNSSNTRSLEDEKKTKIPGKNFGLVAPANVIASQKHIASSNTRKTKKFEPFKYDERQEIKPRANVNKGLVSKTLNGAQQKSKNKIVASSEGVVTKRAAPGRDAVDCNVQKKHLRDRGLRGDRLEGENRESGGSGEEGKSPGNEKAEKVANVDSLCMITGIQKLGAEATCKEHILQEKESTGVGELGDLSDAGVIKYGGAEERKRTFREVYKIDALKNEDGKDGGEEIDVVYKKCGPKDVRKKGKEEEGIGSVSVKEKAAGDDAEIKSQLKMISSRAGKGIAVLRSFTDSGKIQPRIAADDDGRQRVVSNRAVKGVTMLRSFSDNDKIHSLTATDDVRKLSAISPENREDGTPTVVSSGAENSGAVSRRFDENGMPAPEIFAEVIAGKSALSQECVRDRNPPVVVIGEKNGEIYDADNESGIIHARCPDVMKTNKRTLNKKNTLSTNFASSISVMQTFSDKDLRTCAENEPATKCAMSYSSGSLDRMQLNGRNKPEFEYNAYSQRESADILMLKSFSDPRMANEESTGVDSLCSKKAVWSNVISNDAMGQSDSRLWQNGSSLDELSWKGSSNDYMDRDLNGSNVAKSDFESSILQQKGFLTTPAKFSDPFAKPVLEQSDKLSSSREILHNNLNSKQHLTSYNVHYQLENELDSQRKQFPARDSGPQSVSSVKTEQDEFKLGCSSRLIESDVNLDGPKSPETSNSGNSLSLLVCDDDRAKMGQRHTVATRPVVPPRNVSIRSSCTQKEGQILSPIIEDSQTERQLSREQRLNLNGSKARCKQHDAAFLNGSRHVDAANVSLKSDAIRCDTKHGRKNVGDKAKPGNFIASLVRIIKEGREASDNDKKGYNESICANDETQENSLPTESYANEDFIDEEDPFYQFSINKVHLGTTHDINQGIQDPSVNRPTQQDSNVLSLNESNGSTPQYVTRNSDATAQQPTFADGPKMFQTCARMSSAHPSTFSYHEGYTSSNNLFPGVASDFISEGFTSPTRASWHGHVTSQNVQGYTPDFITISGQKDKRDSSAEENRTRLSSFSAATRLKTDQAEGDASEKTMNCRGAYVAKETSEAKGIIPGNTAALKVDRTAEVENNIKKLAELNQLRNSIKLSQSGATKLRKIFVKRKSKKAKDVWWESGCSEIFYSAQEDMIVDDFVDDNTRWENGGHLGLGKQKRTDCKQTYNTDFDLQEVGLKIDCSDQASRTLCSAPFVKGRGREHHDNETENIITGSTSTSAAYYKSVNKGDDGVKERDLSRSDENSKENWHERVMEFGVKQFSRNSPAKPKPSAKIKPYTVVDLSTMSALSPEEVDDCLKEVSVAEKLKWEKYEEKSRDEKNEAPDTLALPPKSCRKRSNTTSTIVSKGKYNPERVSPINGHLPEFPALKIVNMDYSHPGQTGQQQEMSSFRTRAKTEPFGKKEIQKAVQEARAAVHSKETAQELSPIGNKPTLILENSKAASNDLCGTTLKSATSVQSDIFKSQDFPPPPSQEELSEVENEDERSNTPEWPPAPESANTFQDQTELGANTSVVSVEKRKQLFPRNENSGNDFTNTEVAEMAKDVGSCFEGAKMGRACDPHRSLPPIPGGQTPDAASMKDDSPLAWVSRATHVGTGPFIPMCQADEANDLVTAHFYDDIDQIRKVAKERAMMIQRLEEQEARLVTTASNGEVKESRGYMPDVIPVETEDDVIQDRDDAKKQSKRWKKKHKKEMKALVKSDPDLANENRVRSDNDDESISELPLTAAEKKNQSKFRKLIRKLSAPIKTNDRQDFVQRKATTPQLTRKGAYTNKSEDDRSEIFATPATSRRLFSLTGHRNHRQRTTSDTAAIKSIVENESMAETKRGKQKTATISFGFGRKKKKDVLGGILPSDDNQSIKSLEILRISEDVSSDSGSSTRVTPITSPVMFNSENGAKKYRAPNPPGLPDASEDCSISVRSDRTESDASSSENLTKQRMHLSAGGPRNELSNERLTRLYDKVQDVCSIDSSTSDQFVVKGRLQDVKPGTVLSSNQSQKEDEEIIKETGKLQTANQADALDDVFVHEGAYDNYPPSKINVQKPRKPPRSESDDKDTSKKLAPEKPRRVSRETGFVTRPEPYSSQRCHRKIVGQCDGLEARLSPTMSNSEDESVEGYSREYQLPFDNIHLEARKADSLSVTSSASDYCLSGKLSRGNKFYQSDRTMDRPSKQRRRGSLSTDFGDCLAESHGIPDDSYYENVRKAPTTQRDDVLDFSVDSYDKLLEIHRDTVRQIAEATVFKCECNELKGTDWNEFEICGKLLNYGLSSYVTVPVAVKKDGSKSGQKYTAWLRQSLGFLQSRETEQLCIPVQEMTRHENLLHICQDIQRSRDDEKGSSDEVPQDIHVNRMLVSKSTPKMGLTKYLALTMDKHARDPETYEKEACLILLQVLKGLGHLGNNGITVESVDCESILLTDVNRGVLSANFVNNNNNGEVLGCPIAMFVALPGLVKNCIVKRGSIDEPLKESKDKGEVKRPEIIHGSLKGESPSDQKSESEETTGDCKLNTELCRELIKLIFEVFHASHLLSEDFADEQRSLSEVPRLPVKSQYSQRLTSVIETLSVAENEVVSIDDLVKQFQVIAFCPVLMGHVDKEELSVLLDKWRNRRCVDMVTDILKKYSLIALASGLASGGTNSMGLARSCVLECQFLASASTKEITEMISTLGSY